MPLIGIPQDSVKLSFDLYVEGYDYNTGGIYLNYWKEIIFQQCSHGYLVKSPFKDESFVVPESKISEFNFSSYNFKMVNSTTYLCSAIPCVPECEHIWGLNKGNYLCVKCNDYGTPDDSGRIQVNKPKEISKGDFPKAPYFSGAYPFINTKEEYEKLFKTNSITTNKIISSLIEEKDSYHGDCRTCNRRGYTSNPQISCETCYGTGVE